MDTSRNHCLIPSRDGTAGQDDWRLGRNQWTRSTVDDDPIAESSASPRMSSTSQVDAKSDVRGGADDPSFQPGTRFGKRTSIAPPAVLQYVERIIPLHKMRRLALAHRFLQSNIGCRPAGTDISAHPLIFY
jgi:hypothetical protein